MHLLATQSRSLDDDAAAVDLGQSPGDIVVLSFSDSDLGALAVAAEARAPGGPSLRLASLARLKHPYSVDLYAERVVAKARFVLVRLLGGLDYWRYGVEEFSRVARAHGVPLALAPGCEAGDARLDAASTLPPDDLRRLWAFFAHGGSDNMAALLGWLSTHIGRPTPWHEPREVPPAGRWAEGCREPAGATGRAFVTFYRSMMLAGDCAPVAALADALAARGLAVTALHATSLKDSVAAGVIAEAIEAERPDVVVNCTAFSGQGADGRPSVLDRADAPVLQAILAGASEESWRANPRGLGPADLAMNVVLPEMDGRLVTAAISCKAESARSRTLEFTRLVHRPMPDRVAHVADLAAAWARLRHKPAAERRVALVLSDYPGKLGRESYAVGLDTPASVQAICDDLREEGYAVGELPNGWIEHLKAAAPVIASRRRSNPGVAEDDRAEGHPAAPGLLRCARKDDCRLPLAAYQTLLAALPAAFVAAVTAAWGSPADSPELVDGAFPIRVLLADNLALALQPDRGPRAHRQTQYHDAALPPCHAYVAFYLWLRHAFDADALVHLGTHGTLEWCPGKPVAPTADCAPEVVLGPTPLIYPFIVNNPGEAAQAKRRNAAATIGHLTPPLVEAGHHGAATELEALLDEYAAADTLDPKRARLIARTIRERAAESGLAAEAGIDAGADDALQALDGWLCDVKEMRIRDGLHVFARGEDDACATAERRGLLAALAGRFVPGGPAGAPSRGRTDVLPTGRNLYGTDPRAVPSRTATEIGRRAADALAERHAQDHGDWPRTLVLDLWASATMRTAGEDFAQALAHLGVRPRWDHASARVNGFDILPFAALERPRVDVTLRISGLFRDVFATQIALFDAAVRAVAALEEDDAVNPLAAARRAGETPWRIFGDAPQRYGIGLGNAVDADAMVARKTLGETYLATATYAYGGADATGAEAGTAFASRVAGADAFVHIGDMADLDTLDSAAATEAELGFAAAAESLGASPALYHLDAAAPDRMIVRTQAEEIARIVRGRAGNPRWIAGQMRHGFRGAAEIAETIDNLYAGAIMSDAVTSRHFDLVFAATCGSEAVRAFLLDANRDAARAIAQRFRDAATRGFWTSRRNSDTATLDDMLAAAA